MSADLHSTILVSSVLEKNGKIFFNPQTTFLAKERKVDRQKR
jgi:hypothetical protein